MSLYSYVLKKITSLSAMHRCSRAKAAVFKPESAPSYPVETYLGKRSYNVEKKAPRCLTCARLDLFDYSWETLMNTVFPNCEMEGLWIHAESSAYMELV